MLPDLTVTSVRLAAAAAQLNTVTVGADSAAPAAVTGRLAQPPRWALAHGLTQGLKLESAC
jgi:hypothetical protein